MYCITIKINIIKYTLFKSLMTLGKYLALKYIGLQFFSLLCKVHLEINAFLHIYPKMSICYAILFPQKARMMENKYSSLFYTFRDEQEDKSSEVEEEEEKVQPENEHQEEDKEEVEEEKEEVEEDKEEVEEGREEEEEESREVQSSSEGEEPARRSAVLVVQDKEDE